jgi:hypothetical protein
VSQSIAVALSRALSRLGGAGGLWACDAPMGRLSTCTRQKRNISHAVTGQRHLYNDSCNECDALAQTIQVEEGSAALMPVCGRM